MHPGPTQVLEQGLGMMAHAGSGILAVEVHKL